MVYFRSKNSNCCSNALSLRGFGLSQFQVFLSPIMFSRALVFRARGVLRQDVFWAQQESREKKSLVSIRSQRQLKLTSSQQVGEVVKFSLMVAAITSHSTNGILIGGVSAKTSDF